METDDRECAESEAAPVRPTAPRAARGEQKSSHRTTARTRTRGDHLPNRLREQLGKSRVFLNRIRKDAGAGVDVDGWLGSETSTPQVEIGRTCCRESDPSTARRFASGRTSVSRKAIQQRGWRPNGIDLLTVIVNGTPMRRNSMTEKSVVVTDERDFVVEWQRLRESIERFATGGPGICTKHPHFFFGPLTPVEWAALMYQHLDHHLRQFGV